MPCWHFILDLRTEFHISVIVMGDVDMKQYLKGCYASSTFYYYF